MTIDLQVVGFLSIHCPTGKFLLGTAIAAPEPNHLKVNNMTGSLSGMSLRDELAEVIYQADAHQGQDPITQECATRFADACLAVMARRMDVSVEDIEWGLTFNTSFPNPTTTKA